MRLIKITKSKTKGKKYDAYFDIDGKEKRVAFGAEGMSDFTIHKDPERRLRYIARHKKRENWNDPTTPGALSRWILWEESDLGTAIKKYKQRFNI